jgi:hypothetical protein
MAATKAATAISAAGAVISSRARLGLLVFDFIVFSPGRQTPAGGTPRSLLPLFGSHSLVRANTGSKGQVVVTLWRANLQ